MWFFGFNYRSKTKWGILYWQKVLNKRILVLLPIPLAAHTFYSLWNAPRIVCSRSLISLLPPPSLSTIAPRYANSSTSSTSSPFTTMLSLFRANSALIVSHFLAISLRLTLAASSVNLQVFSRKSLHLDEGSAMSSAKSRPSNTIFRLTVSLFCCLLLSSSWSNPWPVRIRILKLHIPALLPT